MESYAAERSKSDKSGQMVNSMVNLAATTVGRWVAWLVMIPIRIATPEERRSY